MKKLPKILITFILIGIALIIVLTRYIDKESDISSKIGSAWTGGQVSMYNHVAISKNFDYYISYLKKDDYEKAYKFLPYEYKKFKNLDLYIEDVKKIDYTKTEIISIIPRTQHMYSIIFSTSSHENLENLIIFDKDNINFTITPEAFLDYAEYKENIKKRNVKYELINTTNYIDKYIVNIKITNLSKKDVVNISNIELIQNDIKHIKGNIKDIKINPEESKNIAVEFKTYIDFPDKIEISRYIEKKNKTETYILNIKN